MSTEQMSTDLTQDQDIGYDTETKEIKKIQKVDINILMDRVRE